MTVLVIFGLGNAWEMLSNSGNRSLSTLAK